MSSDSEDLQLLWLEQILTGDSTNLKISKIVRTEDIESVVPPGENYYSSIRRVKLRCSLQNGSERSISVIVKQDISSEMKNLETDAFTEIFKIEIKVYSVILPLMEKLMAEFNDQREKLWCHFYGHWENRKIVFEDLTITYLDIKSKSQLRYYETSEPANRYIEIREIMRHIDQIITDPTWMSELISTSVDELLIPIRSCKESGFVTLRRTDWLSFERSSLALRNLARFHAMSKILIDRGLIGKSDFTHNSMSTDTELGEKLYAGPLEVLADAMVESWGPEWKDVSNRIKLQVPLVSQKMNELAIVPDDRYLVFNHGDLWACNIMLKTGEKNSVESLRFLDFQFPCMNSFIWDVSIFSFTSIDPTVRRDGMYKLLSIYHRALDENLRFFNCESYIPTLNDVHSEFDRVSFFSFITNMTFFPMFSSNCKPFEMIKIIDHPPHEVFDKSAFTDERIVPELKEDLKIYIEKGVI